jgi:GT2 family glycosyltransferase
VVVDNDSPGGEAARLQAELDGVQVVANDSNRGFAAGVNTGFRSSTAPLVLVLNPDTIVKPGALEALVRALRESPDVGVAVPLLEHEDGSPQPNVYKRLPNLITLFADFCVPCSYALEAVGWSPHSLRMEDALRGAPIAHAYGAALAVRRAAYDAAGPLDEAFFLYLEETDWQERVRAAGWRIALVPEARIVHFVRGGGQAAEVPSTHYLESAYVYFGRRGVSVRRLDAVLLVATFLSQLALLVIGLLPGKAEQSARRRAGWARLFRWVRQRS